MQFFFVFKMFFADLQNAIRIIESKIYPLFITKAKQLLSNYRLLVLLSSVDKTLPRIILKHIEEALEKNQR